MRQTRTDEELLECKEMHDAFDLMKVHDVLVWDSPSVHTDTRSLYGRARDKGWTVRIMIDPPMKTGYRSGVKGRMTITRVS